MTMTGGATREISFSDSVAENQRRVFRIAYSVLGNTGTKNGRSLFSIPSFLDAGPGHGAYGLLRICLHLHFMDCAMLWNHQRAASGFDAPLREISL